MRQPDYANNTDYADGRGSTPNGPPDCGLFRRIDFSRPAKFTIARPGCQRGPERKWPEITAFFRFRDGLQRLGEVDRKRAATDRSPLPCGGEGRRAPPSPPQGRGEKSAPLPPAGQGEKSAANIAKRPARWYTVPDRL